jgi:hypothetical protein
MEAIAAAGVLSCALPGLYEPRLCLATIWPHRRNGVTGFCLEIYGLTGGSAFDIRV